MTLTHSTCGGNIVVDKSRYPIMDSGTPFYFVKCEYCGQKLGVLPEVESLPPTHERSQLAAESAYKKH